MTFNDWWEGQNYKRIDMQDIAEAAWNAAIASQAAPSQEPVGETFEKVTHQDYVLLFAHEMTENNYRSCGEYQVAQGYIDAAAQIAELKKGRDGLLAALKNLMHWWMTTQATEDSDDMPAELFDAAMSLITKAEAETVIRRQAVSESIN